MRTLKQIEAARQNGKHSKGPITAEGKAKSSQNSLIHGMTAGSILLRSENEDRFQAIYPSIYHRFQPRDEAERLCVEEMAWAKWRLRRSLTYETALLEQQIEATTPSPSGATRNANAWAHLHSENPGFRHLTRYETSHRRAYTRALEELAFLQSTKLRNEPDTPQTQEDQAA